MHRIKYSADTTQRCNNGLTLERGSCRKKQYFWITLDLGIVAMFFFPQVDFLIQGECKLLFLPNTSYTNIQQKFNLSNILLLRIKLELQYMVQCIKHKFYLGQNTSRSLGLAHTCGLLPRLPVRAGFRHPTGGLRRHVEISSVRQTN